MKQRTSLLSSLGIGAATAFVSGLLSVLMTIGETRYQWSISEISVLFVCVTLSFLAISVSIAVVARLYLDRAHLIWCVGSVVYLLFGTTLLDAGPAPHTAVVRSISLEALLPLILVGISGLMLRSPLGRRALPALVGVWALGSLFFWSSSLPPHQTSGRADGANVLLVSVDTLRSDHVHSDAIETPHMDALAAQGVRFTSTYAPIAVTGPSHAAMMTGNGPWTTGMLLNGMKIPENQSTLAEFFAAQSYRTGAFVSAYVLDGELGFADNFDNFDDVFRAVKGWDQTGPGRLLGMIERHVEPASVLERTGDRTVDAALRWMGDQQGDAFFAWVHLFDPHGPYSPPSPWDSAYYTGDPRSEMHTSISKVSGVAEYLKPSLEGITDVDWVLAQYAGEVSFVDEQIGRLTGWLEQAGMAENTLVIVVGDHGESLGENDVWFNHGGDLDVSAIRTPMIMRYPGRIAAGTVLHDPVGIVDVAPTVKDLFEGDAAGVDGQSLVPLMNGGVLERPGVRSLCYDREINQKERERGTITGPTHLISRVWTRTGWFQVGSHMSRGAIQRGAASPDAAAVAVITLQSIGSGVHQRVEDREQETLERLKGLGYVE